MNNKIPLFFQASAKTYVRFMEFLSQVVEEHRTHRKTLGDDEFLLYLEKKRQETMKAYDIPYSMLGLPPESEDDNGG